MMTSQALHETQMTLERTMAARMEDFERRLGSISTSSKKLDLEELTRDYISFKESVLPMLRLLQEQILSVATQVDEMDCQTRRNALLFTGIKEEDNDDPSALICDTVVSLMGISEFNRSSMVQCVRLGARRPDATRPILVRLASLATKSQLWNSKTKLKATPVVVGEFLTKPRQRIFMRARRHFGVSSCWTRSGAVMVKLSDDSRVKVVTEAALDELCKKHPAVTPKAKETVKGPPAKLVGSQGKVTPPKGRAGGATAPATRSKTAGSTASREKR
ncbi:hypothetical protein JYU34_000648 [Plutella xylostella]|uniref:Uncharacterized protein n=1 Tax=Plutella xylostella TaxID=51655 RepID=A0ABQ7R876_PLUXY|nr:hypothetical protein JYU34_000648 [Plutella xylostella]